MKSCSALPGIERCHAFSGRFLAMQVNIKTEKNQDDLDLITPKL
jgi:hypothetical protein